MAILTCKGSVSKAHHRIPSDLDDDMIYYIKYDDPRFRGIHKDFCIPHDFHVGFCRLAAHVWRSADPIPH